MTPVTTLADRKNTFAASMSRVSLNLTSTRAPERSMRDKVAPAALDLDIGFVSVPASSDPTSTPRSQTVDQGWGKLRRRVADGLATEFDPPDREHLGQITQAQFVTDTPEHHERDDIRGIPESVQNSTSSHATHRIFPILPQPPDRLAVQHDIPLMPATPRASVRRLATSMV
jgi:hypothetical protein